MYRQGVVAASLGLVNDGLFVSSVQKIFRKCKGGLEVRILLADVWYAQLRCI
jgi:hypothetical protein